MQTISVGVIKIPERFREDQGDVKGLAESFAEHGQLQPIILDQDNTLVAGYRRLMAAAMLGWEEIGFERMEDLSERRRREIELEENLRRKQFEWQEEVKAIAEIHRLRQAEDPNWSAKQTAELIGRGERLAQYAVKLEKNLGIEEVSKAQTMLGAIQRLTAHEQLKEKAIAAKLLEKRAEWEVLEGDCREVLKQIQDESIDCIITDPPFGIDLNYRGEEFFDDSPAATIKLITEVLPQFYRVLKNDSWVVMFFDAVMVQAVYDLAIACGFTVKTRVPAIWYKPNKKSSTGRNPSQIMSTAYEAICVFGKGEPVLVKKGRPNVFEFDSPTPGERSHPTEKSLAVSCELCETFTIGGQLILDPFCGSSKFGVGALRTQRKFLGIEASSRFVEVSRVNLTEALK